MPSTSRPAALELGPDYYRGVVTEYQKRRDTLFDGLSSIPGVFLRKPEGAFYFVARLPIADSDDFAAWLLTDFQKDGKTVMVAPASGFYVTPGLGKDEVRIAYVLKDEDLRRRSTSWPRRSRRTGKRGAWTDATAGRGCVAGRALHLLRDPRYLFFFAAASPAGTSICAFWIVPE